MPVSETFTSVYINNPVNFTKGTHEITVARVNEGWLLDSIEIVPLTEEIKNLITPSNKLAIKNPSKKTQALFDYLLSQRGKSILSGQYIYSDMNDINVIEEVTGKYPAIMGIDLIDYSPSRVEHGTRGTVIRKAKAWAKKNGIITAYDPNYSASITTPETAKEDFNKSWEEAKMSPAERTAKIRQEQENQIAQAKERTSAANARIAKAKEYRK